MSNFVSFSYIQCWSFCLMIKKFCKTKFHHHRSISNNQWLFQGLHGGFAILHSVQHQFVLICSPSSWLCLQKKHCNCFWPSASSTSSLCNINWAVADGESLVICMEISLNVTTALANVILNVACTPKTPLIWLLL